MPILSVFVLLLKSRFFVIYYRCVTLADGMEKPSPLGRGDRIAVGEVNLIRPHWRSATFPKGEGLSGRR